MMSWGLWLFAAWVAVTLAWILRRTFTLESLLDFLIRRSDPKPVAETKFPIGSAPKDGRLIKLWFGFDEENPTVGWWAPENCQDKPWLFLDEGDKLSKFFVNRVVDRRGGPSHWAPL